MSENIEIMTIDGVFSGNLWRDEANGKSFFALVTKKTLILEKMYSNTFISNNPLTNINEKWYEVKVNGFDKATPAIERGVPIRIKGYFINDERSDNWTFKLVDFELFSNDDIVAIRYLIQLGLKDEDAKNIVKRYGNMVFNYTQNDGFKTYLKSFLSEKKTDEIIIKLERIISEKNTFELFSEANIPYPYVIKAVKHYGMKASSMIKTYPYQVGLKIGLTFRQCDTLALKMGFSATNTERFKALSRIIMNSFESSGNIYTPIYKFKKQANYRINKSIFEEVSTSSVFMTLKDDEYDTEDGLIFNKALKEAEERAAQNVKRLAVAKAEPFSEDYIPIIESDCGMKFGKEQLMAFDMFRERGIKILTGGPGTGKTTTVKGLIMCYRMMHPDHKIKLCAPTGRAAQRLSEQAELPATTIHKLLNYSPYGDNPSFKDSNNPIDAEFIVIDECSMIDIDLFDKLLDAIKNNTTLLLVGDIHQLESVGAGAVLRDLLSADSINIKKTYLTEVFRQKGGSPIIDNSVKINRGETDLVTCDDFQIYNKNNQSEMFESVKGLYLSIYNKNDPYESQILCPSYKGECGIDKLNVAIRDILNPNGKTLVYGFHKYRVGDKVIFTKNNMDSGYYNGDIGIIKSIEDDSMTISIKDMDIVLTRENFDDLSLAYAITVHRSQGSEFKNVIMVMPKEPKSMLLRNLFYTGITRAKKTVYIVNEVNNGNAMEIAINTDKTDDRMTKLSKLIKN